MDHKYNREKWIKCAIEMGYTCNPETGDVFGLRGNALNAKNVGYKIMNVKNEGKLRFIFHHQFIWYYVNNEVVDCIDHINGDKLDNRICNLRSVTQQKNCFNKKNIKGFHFRPKLNKWHCQINSCGKKIYLGLYNTKEEAHQTYLDAKKIYHVI